MLIDKCSTNFLEQNAANVTPQRPICIKTLLTVAENWVYPGVRTCELFLCFAPFVFLGSIVFTCLVSLFYVAREFKRFLHRG